MLKKFKEFESLREEDEPIDLVGYPSGSIIEVTPEEFHHMMELQDDDKLGFEIKWDDEVDYEEGSFGQWRYLDEEEDDLERELFKMRDPVGYTAKKYNI